MSSYLLIVSSISILNVYVRFNLCTYKAENEFSSKTMNGNNIGPNNNNGDIVPCVNMDKSLNYMTWRSVHKTIVYEF